MTALLHRARLLCFVGGMLPASLHAADAAPSTAGRNPAAAQALFEEAQRKVAEGDYDAACPKFKASYALDPGGGTLLNLADCLEKQGRTASAWSTFKDARVQAQRDGRSERVEYAEQHIQALEGKLGYLTVEVPAASRAAGLEIEVDGTPLVPAAWGSALPMDPGEHVVRARAPGFEPLERISRLGAGAGTREVFELPPLRAARASDTGATPPPMQASEPEYPARTWGWVTGGVGLVALGVGSYFGVQAFSKWDDREKACIGGCTQAAKLAGDDASSAATLATAGVGAGVVLIGVATVLLFYSGDAEAPQAASGLSLQALDVVALDHGAAVGWKGRF